jgi:FKBP-type peptidyl-prolyl cis-trans isomerase FkpA
MSTQRALWLLALVALPSGCDRLRPRARNDAPTIEVAPAIAGKPTAGPGLEGDNDKLLYLFGRQVGASVANSIALKPEELRIVLSGMSDRVNGVAPSADVMKLAPTLNTFVTHRNAERLLAEKLTAHAELEKAAQAEGAKTTASGLVFTSLAPGAGAAPKYGDNIEAHFQLRLNDQTLVDDTRVDGQSVNIVIGQTFACLSEGLMLMRMGGKARLTCPPQLAFGDNGSPPNIPGGAAVTYEIELLAIHPPTAPTAAEPPPASAHGKRSRH